jgi:SPP1 family predicted phage head-tail adaptor
MKVDFIDPGLMRRELSLQSLVPVADGAGGYDETWQEAALVFGAVEPVSALSFRAAAQALEETTHRITIRWREDVKQGMRFALGSRVFAIQTAHDPDETRRYLVCMVKEDVS